MYSVLTFRIQYDLTFISTVYKGGNLNKMSRLTFCKKRKINTKK